MLATLHLIQDDDKPAEIIAALLDALPGGSYFVASHITMEHAADAIAAGQRTMRRPACRPRPAAPTSSPDWRSPACNWCPRAWCSSRSGARPATAPGRRRPR